MSSEPTFASWDACLPHTARWLSNSDIGQRKVVPGGTRLYQQSDMHRDFYLIRSGFVQTAMNHENGRRLLLEVMGPGSMFGEGAAFEQTPRFVDAWTVTACELSMYEPAEVTKSQDAVELLEDLIKLMAAKQRILALKLLQFSNDEPELRLRHLIARVVAVQARSKNTSNTQVSQIWISQEKLGEMCGMSRVSAARSLRRMAKAGLVVTHPKYVEVLDVDGLLNNQSHHLY
ncbi:Crp/Fnr family transcriptional regulator [Bordetella pseudohinzii]|uniref:Crp/Fnr family transcriptional regulator n=1 Tax=Bordetella pseudohinzii TaxID=1331258 RepID=UPI0009E575B1|nr:Crp/Fnr family transcriptional regulator [Bordetella pseudohinzii]